MASITPIATNAVIMARMDGISLTCSPEGLSTKTTACVMKMLVYRASKANGAVTGRRIAMIREPTAQEAVGKTNSIRTVGRKIVSVCSARHMIETAKRTIVRCV